MPDDVDINRKVAFIYAFLYHCYPVMSLCVAVVEDTLWKVNIVVMIKPKADSTFQVKSLGLTETTLR